MARKHSPTVKGMKVSDILKMDTSKFESLSKSDQRAVVSRVASAANKRLRTFDKYNEASSAVIEFRASGNDFMSIKGKEGKSLIEEFERGRKFMRQAISKRSEYNKVVKKIQKGWKNKGIVNATIEQAKQILRALDELAIADPDTTKRAYKYKITREIAQAYLYPNEGKSTGEIYSDILNEVARAESNIHASDIIGDITSNDDASNFSSFFADTDDF